MKTRVAIVSILYIAWALGTHEQSMPMRSMSGFLRLVQTSPLPTQGYMDHLAVDVKGQRLFICGEANKRLIDLRSGKLIHQTRPEK